MRSINLLSIVFGILSSLSSWGQVLNVTVVKKESCSGSNSGSISITIDNTTTTAGPYGYTVFGVNTSTFNSGTLTKGVTTLISNLAPDNYFVSVSDNDNTVANYSSFQLIGTVTAISGISTTPVNNSDQTCLSPNGSITINAVNGGSGSYSFAWTSSGFTSTSQNISNLKGGSYTVVVTDQTANCTFTSSPIIITDPLPSTFTISSPDVTLCNGENLVVDILPTTPTNGIQYTLYDGAIAVGTTATWPTSQIVFSGLSPGLHSNIRVEGKLGGSICDPIFSTNTLAVNVSNPPASATLSLVGPTPICEGTSSSVQATITGGAAPYSFSLAGLATPITGYNGSPIAVSPIITTNYTFSTVITDNNGCTVSGTGNALVVVNPKPTITLGALPNICIGTATANLGYTAITGSPDQYSIDFDAAAEANGFVDVVNAALPASPIVITVPGVTAGVYSASFTVRNSVTGCISDPASISVTVVDKPTITLNAIPGICIGATTANLGYTAITGSPDQYSIDFDAAAEAQGFVDVVSAALPTTPIVIAVPGSALVGTYNATLIVSNSAISCVSTGNPISITIADKPTITVGANPSVCIGTTSANLGYTAISGSPDQYSIDFDATAEAQGFVDVVNTALPATPIVITIPGAALAGIYNAGLTVRNSITGCVSNVNGVTVTIIDKPTITLSALPNICIGTATANLGYTAITGSPDQYSIDFNATAEANGFVDVINAALPASPIVITVPGVTAGVYSASFTIRNSVTGCVSNPASISITVVDKPTITLGINPSVCLGTATANLSYSAVTGTPDQYSIDFDAAAEAQGFVDVASAALPATPIVITVPGSAVVGTYTANLIVSNSSINCVSNGNAISVTITDKPAITLGTSPSVCLGTATADLGYSAVTGTPDQYSINFDAAAEAKGFIDVVNAALPSSPIVIAIPGVATLGTYNATLTVRNSISGCLSAASSITVTIEAKPTITLGTGPNVCMGTTTGTLSYTSITGSPDQYSIDFDASAEAEGFVDVVNLALPASPIIITVPSTALANTYDAVFTVRNSVTGCISDPTSISITVLDQPTITLGASPSVCSGTTSATLAYTATTSTPDQYSINFDATAEAQGFADVVNAILPATPITIIIPGAAAAGTYNATLSVSNSGGGCVGAGNAITVTIQDKPTITLSTSPTVCLGATTANLGYTATTGTPNQYSINFDAAAEAAGFVDVANAALPATPIVLPIPGTATASTYNATLTVRNTTTGCVSISSSITITIVNTPPTITLGTNPMVCIGAATANLSYSAVTGNPDQYSINFDATAEAAGFIDVVNATLPATPIVITVPGTAIAGTYNALLTVGYSSGGGCVDPGNVIAITIEDNPSITLSPSPTVCLGATTASLAYTATTGTPDQYSVDFDATAEAAGFVDVVNAALPASPIGIIVSGTAVAGTYNATLSVRNSITSCVSAANSISVTIQASPAITLATNPSVCVGSTAASLAYTATTGAPDQYSIDFDATAEAEGFVDVVNAALPASPIGLIVPGAAVAGTYNADLTVRNSTTGCVSILNPVTVTLSGTPATITLGASPTLCIGNTVANVVYSATTGSPDQYSIDFDATAEANGFVDVVNATLPATPIVITVPATAIAGIYNATLIVSNSGGGCAGTGNAITITIENQPTITLSAIPTVCLGNTTANLSYTATSGTPDQYSIDFDAAAEAEGFVDIVNAAIPVTPIGIIIPGAAVAGTYNGNITVRNSIAGCSGTATAISVAISSVPTASLSGNPTICAGQPASLTVTLTGIQPWSIVYTDGTTTFPAINGITSSPYTLSVPSSSASYSLVSVSNSACGAGTVSGSGSVTATPILGDPTVSGADTWIGYVYTDAGSAAPPVSNINYASGKYRGFINDAEIDAFGTSSYNTGTDAFDLNFGNAIPLAGANICGSYLDDYSIRFKMTKTFAAGSYTFSISADDGVRLFRVISGVLTPVTLSPGGSFNTHGYNTYTSNVICLSAGSHDLVIEYFERGGFSRVAFNYALTPAPTVAAIPPTSACLNGTAPTLTATSTDPGVTGFNWYTDATLLNKVATTAVYTPSAAELDLTTVNTTTFYVTAAFACGEGAAIAAVVNVINSVNTALVVTPTIDPVCSGGVSGIKITASESGVSYQLRDDSDNSPVGTAVTGTGGDIVLPTNALTATTTFNILASAGTCSIQLTTEPTVNVSGTINAGLTVTPANASVCTGTSTDIQILASEAGVSYQLRNDADDSLIGTPVAGTGLAPAILLPTGNLSTLPSITFNILASNGTCSIELTTLITIGVDSNPDVSLVVDSDVIGTLCVGGSANITVDLSEVGVSYQLRDDSNDSPVGASIAGTGTKIFLPTGPLNATTTFNVLATSGVCTPAELTTTKTINVAGSVALNLSVTPVDAAVCNGSATTIEIANSEVGVTYQLRNDADDSLIGAAVAGTGSTTVQLSLPTGNLTTLPSITFNVLASSVTCSAELTNKATVTVGTNPDATLAVTVPPATLCVNGATFVTVVNSENGVSYQLRNDADDSLIGSAVAGTGADILLPTGNLAATITFNVLATSGACAPVELNTTATVNVSGTIASNLGVTANASPICSGTATTIDVAGSDAAVTYQLRDNTTNAAIGTALTGNGGILNLPTVNLTSNTTFNVLASNGTCSIQLTTTASVTVTAAPGSALGVTAQNPTLCTTNTGTNIRVANSENGVPYQLRDGTTNIGTSVTGTGATIDLPTGNLAATTTFNVFAGLGTCSVQLATTVTVTIISTPAINLSVTAQSATLCTTNTGTNIRVANSENGVSYQLRDGVTNIGTSVTGTGATIDLPTGTLSATATFNVFASVGTCSAQLTATATVTVTSTPDISLGVTAQTPLVCTTNTGSNIRVANSQTGASYQLRDGATNVGTPINGTGGTISLPTGSLTATTTFNVFASLGATCAAQLTTTATVTVTSGPDINLGVTAQSTSVCTNTGTNIRVANSENGASYQLRDGTTNVGSPITGTGGIINLPTGSLTANTTFNVFVTIGTCSAQLTATAGVTILASTDPSCSGGGTDCFAFIVTIDPVLSQRPTCNSGQNNGRIVFKVEGALPGNYLVTLLKAGVALGAPPSGPSGTTYDFANLSPGSYQYKIQTQSGVTCIRDFDLLVQSTVNANATEIKDATCFGKPTGSAKIEVTSGGVSPFEYSLDGLIWTPFVSPKTISDLPPSATPYSILVRDDASDLCPASVLVTIGNAFTQIVASITPQTSATCNNNDGSVLVAYSGGDATGSGYTFELDGKSFTMPTDKIIRNLSGGNHILKVIDNQLCSITLSGTQFAVASPGLIQFQTVATADPSCIGNGEDGMITVAFPTGANEVAITQDADRSTPVFKDVPTNGVVEYKNLAKGRYYITVKSKVNGCPNERAIDILGGPSRISFTQEMTCELGAPVLKVSNINVATGSFEFQITKLGDTTPSLVTLTGIPAGGIYYIKGTELPSATGDYEIKLVQVQGVCTISSAISRYTNRGSLTVNAANILPSYSDIATGAFNLTNFAGGTVPYYASIRFDSASNPVNEVGFETDMEEVDSDPSTFGYIKKYNKLHAGRYHVTVNEEGGCSVEFDVRVPIDYTFSVNNIPNIFTPNGDGVNDFFFVRNLPSDSQLIISNRWGNQVYSSKSYQNDWSGGSAVDGVYYYRLKAGDEVVTGWIEIMRGK